MSETRIELIWDHLDQFVQKRDLDIATRAPAPPTLTHLYWIGATMLVAFVAGLLGNFQALTATRSWTAWAAVTVAQAAIGVAGLRIAWARRAAISWLVAVTGAVLIAAISVIISLA